MMMVTWAWSLLSLLISAAIWYLFHDAEHMETRMEHTRRSWMNMSMYKNVLKRKKGEEMSSKIPRGSLGWPVIGETLEFIASGYSSRPVAFMEKRKSLYGKVFRTNILGKPIIVSTDPDVNKAVLQNHGNVFIPSYPKSVTELLGKSSILQTNGPLQKRLHSLIGGYFRSPQFKSRIAREIEDYVKVSLSTWEHKKLPILVQDETKQITFEILVKVLMSVGPGEDMEFLKREFQEFIKGIICIPIKFPGTRLYKSLQAKKKLFNMVRKIVEERNLGMAKTGEKTSGSPIDVIQALLSDTKESSDNTQQLQGLPLDIVTENIIEMMIAGEDSVPMVMTLAVKSLSDTPATLSRVVEENMTLKRQKATSCDGFAWTDYMSLQFTQNVITETLRMANIINAVWRKAQKDVEIKGFLIPKDWCVMTSFTSVHLDDENYENPYQFNPWRWEKTRGMVNNSITFTPFGGGQRLCPGLELSRLEISIFLHHFVTKYRWEVEDDNIVTFPTVKMKRKLPITIVPMVQQHY
nr:PREDICTED: 3-epi-6-deoxocathasterone 23-monooxygenase isoform X1 [Daucus carota subsp. sativus]